MTQIYCGKCDRLISLRKDGKLPKHNIRLGMGWNRSTESCPWSQCLPETFDIARRLAPRATSVKRPA